MSEVLTDIFGVPLEVGQRVLYATSWHHWAAIRVGTLIALEPGPVVQPDRHGGPLPRQAQALAVLSEIRNAEAQAWLRRRLDDIEEG